MLALMVNKVKSHVLWAADVAITQIVTIDCIVEYASH